MIADLALLLLAAIMAVCVLGARWVVRKGWA
jgi:hypothetical protein